ncbi:MAG: DinB family protein [Chitinophagaceae bacterium]|nr:DinB family protein [Chitinophagaceae bacterium]
MKIKNIDNEIREVFDDVIQSVNSTNDEELNELPFEGSWTIGQVAAHIILCSGGVLDNQTKEAGRPYDEKVAELRSIFLDMEQKSETAPAVYPSMRMYDKQELVKQLESNKANLLGIIEERDLMQLSLDMEFPFMGYLTRYEWLAFICVHTQRHLNQMNNIKRRLAATADTL